MRRGDRDCGGVRSRLSWSSDDFVWNVFTQLAEWYIAIEPVLVPTRYGTILYVEDDERDVKKVGGLETIEQDKGDGDKNTKANIDGDEDKGEDDTSGSGNDDYSSPPPPSNRRTPPQNKNDRRTPLRSKGYGGTNSLLINLFRIISHLTKYTTDNQR